MWKKVIYSLILITLNLPSIENKLYKNFRLLIQRYAQFNFSEKGL